MFGRVGEDQREGKGRKGEGELNSSALLRLNRGSFERTHALSLMNFGRSWNTLIFCYFEALEVYEKGRLGKGRWS